MIKYFLVLFVCAFAFSVNAQERFGLPTPTMAELEQTVAPDLVEIIEVHCEIIVFSKQYRGALKKHKEKLWQGVDEYKCKRAILEEIWHENTRN